jgi:membrane protein YqaA with SNARE-associated domain
MIWAYLALFAVCFAAATVLPLSSEAALAALVSSQSAWAAPVAVATLGNVLGSATTFWIGWRAGAYASAHQPRLAARLDRASRLLRRWGSPALALAWVPVIGDVLVGAAGALRLPWPPALLWIAIGKAARYLAVAGATMAALS